MDMIYPLPFRDWRELNSRPGVNTQQIASAEPEIDSGSGDSADVPVRHRRAHRRG
jgi:hypothetical protein